MYLQAHEGRDGLILVRAGGKGADCQPYTSASKLVFECGKQHRK